MTSFAGRRFRADADPSEMGVGQKLLHISWPFVLLITITASVGFAMLYSAANGSFDPWTKRQMIRFGIALALMLCVSLTDIRIWLRYAYWLYFGGLALLGAVEVMGTIGMGAQRWLNLGVIQLQPSELMKIVLVLGLARYFNAISHEDVGRPAYLIIPAAMIAAPAILVLRQPDLGTAGMLAMAGAAMFLLAGVKLWKFALAGALAMAAVPLAWTRLHDYQQKRVLTFLNPESDPLGAGYHILQSKIALGSGGLFGKGFINGSQSHLNFLPEKQTDFIFTMLAEEFGLVGGLGLIGLYILILAYCIWLTLRVRNQFGRLLGMGIATTFFLYAFINIAMVMGLIPVVGVPLPLISYGGTAMLTLMFGFGLMLSASVHRTVTIGRSAYADGY